MTHFETLAVQSMRAKSARISTRLLERAVHKAHSARKITYPQYQHLISILDQS